MSNLAAPRRTISKAPPNNSPSLHRRHPTRPSPTKAAILFRCSSAPSLPAQSYNVNHDREAKSGPPLFPRQTSMVLPSLPFKQEKNEDEAWKVVVSVTVEGSPGPVRAMVSKAATVEETINLVLGKYRAEGRNQRLVSHDPASFELHPSYFSLQSLDKKKKIGGVGSRSFYLRKATIANEDPTKQGHQEEPDIIRARGGQNDTGNSSCGEDYVNSGSFCSMIQTPLCFTYIARNIGRFGRRLRKLWSFFGCMVCG